MLWNLARLANQILAHSYKRSPELAAFRFVRKLTKRNAANSIN